MQICFLRHAYFPDDPRDRKQVYALSQAGFDVDVICLQNERQAGFEVINNISVYRIPIKHERRGFVRYLIEYFASFLTMFLLVSIMHFKKKYDVIQVCTMPDFLVFATIIPKFLNAKVILDMHEPTPELWLTKNIAKRNKAIYKLLIIIEQLSIKYADYVITVTESLKSKLKHRGADTDKISVFNNVCDEVFWNKCEQIHKKNDKYKLVTHGLIEKRYGHELVLKAIKELSSSIPNIQYDIFGRGEYTEELIRIVNQLGLTKNVCFRNYLPFEALIENLSTADIGIVPILQNPYSDLVETNKMYEYIALGIPVIISKTEALSLNFRNGEVMFFQADNWCDLSSKIRRLYENPMEGKKMAKNAAIRIKGMRWRKQKIHYIELFNSIREK